MQYCSLQHRPLLLSPVTSTTGYCFALAPSLHSFWSYFSTIPSSILGTSQPGEFLFQYPIILPFHTVHGVLKARILKWFVIPFSSGPHAAFLNDQCKETEENNRMGKTRDLFKKIRDTKATFHAKMGTIKDRNSMDLSSTLAWKIPRTEEPGRLQSMGS